MPPAIAGHRICAVRSAAHPVTSPHIASMTTPSIIPGRNNNHICSGGQPGIVATNIGMGTIESNNRWRAAPSNPLARTALPIRIPADSSLDARM